jgi:hypothetical protein
VYASVNDLVRYMLNGPARFAIPVAVLGGLKIAGLLILHLSLGPSSTYVPSPMLSLHPENWTRFPILYLLTNWDSGWFLRIARYGCRPISNSVPGIPSAYFPLCFNFFPAYPLAIMIVNMLLGDWVLSAAMISIVGGLCCVVVWQSMCEDYLPKVEAALSTLVTFLFPPLFFVTTVAYSESLYLLVVLLSWRFLTRNRIWSAAVFAGLASIVRSYGVVAMAPVMYRAWKQRKWKDWAAIVGSLIPLASWFFWGYLETSIPLVYVYAHSTGWGELPTTVGLVSMILAGASKTSLANTWPWLKSLDVLVIVSLAVVFCLFCYHAVRVNSELGTYGFIQYFIAITFGDWTALMRYLGTVFPAWSIFVRRWRLPIFVAVSILFYAGGMYLWQQFLIGGRAP